MITLCLPVVLPIYASRLRTHQRQREEWFAQVKYMAERIVKMRTALRDALVACGAPGNWDHIVNQIGMFSYTGIPGTCLVFIFHPHHRVHSARVVR